MIHQPEYISALLKKHMELRASPSEIEMLLLGLDLYDEEEIVQILDRTDPDINFEEYRNRDWKTPPFRTLQHRINKRPARRIAPMVKTDFVRAAVFTGIFLLAGLAAWFFRSP